MDHQISKAYVSILLRPHMHIRRPQVGSRPQGWKPLLKCSYKCNIPMQFWFVKLRSF